MAIQQHRRISPWGFVGVAGMVAMFFPYAASGLVAPYWAVGVLLVVWLVLMVVTCRWFMPYPKRTLVMPVVALVVWFGAVTAGGVLLDWTA
ncbi:hypothetical protein [Nocardioides sp.]|uniref:hypothetical protein n=1 Tax=Nocardioides sp. TaxID=35761 RepID=UPI001A2E6BD7|nr:hypothetical protein [Nocardioides sp.]MBJ7359967.1 hypothetical protein [Nocardioides sp.]